ncbi:MAG: hypothetical protein P8X88_05370 [Gammaproteobacteria bacterium]
MYRAILIMTYKYYSKYSLLFLLILICGCASNTNINFQSSETRSDIVLSKTKLILSDTPTKVDLEIIHDPIDTVSEGVGAGLVYGPSSCFLLGPLAGPTCLIFFGPVLAATGAVVGGAAGGINEETELKKLQRKQKNELIRQASNPENYNKQLEKSINAYALDNEIIFRDIRDKDDNKNDSLTLTVGFKNISVLDYKSSIKLVAVAELTDIDGNQHFYKHYKYSAPVFKKDTLLKNNAVLLSQVVLESIERVAEWIVDDIFLLYSFNYASAPNNEITNQSRICVPLIPISPLPKPKLIDVYGDLRIDTIQPTFAWDVFPSEWHESNDKHNSLQRVKDVTYELRIYEDVDMHPRSTDLGREVYSKKGITKASHQIDQKLEACKMYRWTVRAQFSLDGQTYVTDWSVRPEKLFGKYVLLHSSCISTRNRTSDFEQFSDDAPSPYTSILGFYTPCDDN